MKKSLACADLGAASCSFEVRSENKEELKDAMMFHAQKYHPEKMKNLSEKEKLEMSGQMEKMMK